MLNIGEIMVVQVRHARGRMPTMLMIPIWDIVIILVLILNITRMDGELPIPKKEQLT